MATNNTPPTFILVQLNFKTGRWEPVDQMTGSVVFTSGNYVETIGYKQGPGGSGISGDATGDLNLIVNWYTYVAAPGTVMAIDRANNPGPTPIVTTPNLDSSFDTWGNPIPIIYGTVRITGKAIYGKAIQIQGAETDPATLNIGFAFGYPLDPLEVVTIGRLWANGIEIYNPTDGPLITGLSFVVYQGSETQLRDPTIEADKGTNRTPAYRGMRWIMFNIFPVNEIGGSVPQISAEFISATRVNLSDVYTLVATRGTITATCTNVTDVMDGAVFASDFSFQQLVKDTQGVYNIATRRGNPVELIRRPINDSLVLDAVFNEADLIPFGGNDGNAHVIEFNRREQTEIPNQIEIRYTDQQLLYQNGSQYARRMIFPVRQTTSTLIASVQLQFGHTAAEAILLAYDWLYRSWVEGLTPKFSVNNMALEPGDVVQLNSDQGTYVVKVTKNTLRWDTGVNEIESKAILPRFALNTTTVAGDVIEKTREFVLTQRGWRAIAGSADMSFVVAGDYLNYSGGDLGYVYRSITAGERFSRRIPPGFGAWPTHSLACSRSSVTLVAVNLEGEIWYSHSRGDAWILATRAIGNGKTVCCCSDDGNIIVVGGGATSGATPGIEWSHDGGVTFTASTTIDLDVGFSEYISDLCCDASGQNVFATIVSTANAGYAISVNGGQDWGVRVLAPTFGGVRVRPQSCIMSRDGIRIAYGTNQANAVGSKAQVYVSIDSGLSFAAHPVSSSGGIIVGLCGSMNFESIIALDPINNEVWKSTDEGATWTLIQGFSITPLVIDTWEDACMSDDGSKVLICGALPGYIWRSEDGGTTFTKQIT